MIIKRFILAVLEVSGMGILLIILYRVVEYALMLLKFELQDALQLFGILLSIVWIGFAVARIDMIRSH